MTYLAAILIVFPLGVFSQEISVSADSIPAAANAEFPDKIVLPAEFNPDEIEHFMFSTEKFDWDFIKQHEISISSFDDTQPFVLEQPKMDLSFLNNIDKELKYLPHFDYQNNIFNRSQRDDLWANMYKTTLFSDKNFSITSNRYSYHSYYEGINRVGLTYKWKVNDNFSVSLNPNVGRYYNGMYALNPNYYGNVNLNLDYRVSERVTFTMNGSYTVAGKRASYDAANFQPRNSISGGAEIEIFEWLKIAVGVDATQMGDKVVP